MTILLIVKTHFGGSWVNGCAMRNLLLIHPISYLKEVVEVNTARLIEALRGCTYSKWWCLMLHGCFFMVKSFYKFLIDQRLSCSVIPSLQKNESLREVNLFCWLTWDNRVPTLVNQAKWRCISNLHSLACFAIHILGQLIICSFIHCSFIERIQIFFFATNLAIFILKFPQKLCGNHGDPSYSPTQGNLEFPWYGSFCGTFGQNRMKTFLIKSFNNFCDYLQNCSYFLSVDVCSPLSKESEARKFHLDC